MTAATSHAVRAVVGGNIRTAMTSMTIVSGALGVIGTRSISIAQTVANVLRVSGIPMVTKRSDRKHRLVMRARSPRLPRFASACPMPRSSRKAHQRLVDQNLNRHHEPTARLRPRLRQRRLRLSSRQKPRNHPRRRKLPGYQKHPTLLELELTLQTRGRLIWPKVPANSTHPRMARAMDDRRQSTQTVPHITYTPRDIFHLPDNTQVVSRRILKTASLMLARPAIMLKVFRS
jgi:hypothetical protein